MSRCNIFLFRAGNFTRLFGGRTSIQDDSSSNVLKFLSNKGKDSSGRTISEIISQDCVWWERNHDFIQWVFPTKTRSNFNPDAPIVDKIELTEENYKWIHIATVTFINYFTLYTDEKYHYDYNHWWLRLSRFLEFRTLLVKDKRLYSSSHEVLQFLKMIVKHHNYPKFKEYRIAARKANKGSTQSS